MISRDPGKVDVSTAHGLIAQGGQGIGGRPGHLQKISLSTPMLLNYNRCAAEEEGRDWKENPNTDNGQGLLKRRPGAAQKLSGWRRWTPDWGGENELGKPDRGNASEAPKKGKSCYRCRVWTSSQESEKDREATQERIYKKTHRHGSPSRILRVGGMCKRPEGMIGHGERRGLQTTGPGPPKPPTSNLGDGG